MFLNEDIKDYKCGWIDDIRVKNYKDRLIGLFETNKQKMDNMLEMGISFDNVVELIKYKCLFLNYIFDYKEEVKEYSKDRFDLDNLYEDIDMIDDLDLIGLSEFLKVGSRLSTSCDTEKNQGVYIGG